MTAHKQDRPTFPPRVLELQRTATEMLIRYSAKKDIKLLRQIQEQVHRAITEDPDA